MPFLKSKGVTAIVNVGAGGDTTGVGQIGRYLKIGVKDKKGVLIGPYFDTVADFIDEETKKAGGCVFVHCWW